MKNSQLHNQNNKEKNLELLSKEKFKRITLSFYKYIKIKNIDELRNELFLNFNKIGILGGVSCSPGFRYASNCNCETFTSEQLTSLLAEYLPANRRESE